MMFDMIPHSASERGRVHWVAIVALVVLAAGLGVAATQWRSPGKNPGPAPKIGIAVPADTSDAVIGEALAQVPVDSTELKNRWLDEIPGLDVSMLTHAQHERLVRVLNSYRCTCGCGFTLATCRAYDLTCPVSGPRVEALRDSVRAGLVPVKGLRERPTTHG
jgi:hypothetical protein